LSGIGAAKLFRSLEQVQLERAIASTQCKSVPLYARNGPRAEHVAWTHCDRLRGAGRHNDRK
jgi:hypothetical protein